MRCRTEVLLVRGYASGCKNRNATARYVPLRHFGNAREAPRHADGNRSLRPLTAVGPPLQRQWTGVGPLTAPFRFSFRRRTVCILAGAFRPPPSDTTHVGNNPFVGQHVIAYTEPGPVPPPRAASPSGRSARTQRIAIACELPCTLNAAPLARPRRREVIARCATLSPTLRPSYAGTTPVSTPRSPKRPAVSPPSCDGRTRGPLHGLKHP